MYLKNRKENQSVFEGQSSNTTSLLCSPGRLDKIDESMLSKHSNHNKLVNQKETFGILKNRQKNAGKTDRKVLNRSTEKASSGLQ